MKKAIVFLFSICFSCLAQASIAPTITELNTCISAFDGSKSYGIFVVFLCSCFIFIGCILYLILQKKKKDITYYLNKHRNDFKKIIAGFVSVLSLILIIYTYNFLPHKNPSVCLDYRICGEQYELYKYDVDTWCYENIHLIKNHWNSTNSVCLNECLAFKADKNGEICKKCEEQHWQFKVFEKFKDR